MKSLADKDSYTPNDMIREKMLQTANPVTRSVYRSIIKNRAIRAIEKQPYFNNNNNNNKHYGNSKTVGTPSPNNKKV